MSKKNSGLIAELIMLILKQAALAVQDLLDGRIDVSKIDLDKARAGLIALPRLPEEGDDLPAD